MNKPSRTQSAHDEKRMELTEHLGELRTRLMRSILYLTLGAIITYQLFPPIYAFFYDPLGQQMKIQNKVRAQKQAAEAGIVSIPYASTDPVSREEFNKLVRAYNLLIERPAIAPFMTNSFKSFWEPFLVRLKVSIITGFVLVLPLIIWELISFIAPALTPQERRPFRLLIPVSMVLMLFGVAVGYITMYFAMRWFLSYLPDFPDGSNLMQDPNDYILFFVKMMAAFGLAFQLPVVLMGLAFVGLVTSAGLTKHWRWGVVLAALGGLFTPANDIFSMALMSFPLLLLYGVSIFLVRLIERMKKSSKPA